MGVWRKLRYKSYTKIIDGVSEEQRRRWGKDCFTKPKKDVKKKEGMNKFQFKIVEDSMGMLQRMHLVKEIFEDLMKSTIKRMKNIAETYLVSRREKFSQMSGRSVSNFGLIKFTPNIPLYKMRTKHEYWWSWRELLFQMFADAGGRHTDLLSSVFSSRGNGQWTLDGWTFIPLT